LLLSTKTRKRTKDTKKDVLIFVSFENFVVVR